MNEHEMKVKCLELAQAFSLQTQTILQKQPMTPDEVIQRAETYYEFLNTPYNMRQPKVPIINIHRDS